MKDGDKKIQWHGFIRKAKLADAPKAFEDVVAAVKMFLEPLAASLAEKRDVPLASGTPPGRGIDQSHLTSTKLTPSK